MDPSNNHSLSRRAFGVKMSVKNLKSLLEADHSLAYLTCYIPQHYTPKIEIEILIKFLWFVRYFYLLSFLLLVTYPTLDPVYVYIIMFLIQKCNQYF